MKSVLSLCFLVMIAVTTKAQKKDTVITGSIHGNVKDSAYDFVLPAATIAVYRAADSTLLTFQLTDGLGDFHIEKVPLDIPLKVVVTFMGYQPHIIKTTIPKAVAKLDLKVINMERGAHTLKDVVITRPPVEMNGDTLEFNADAFRLDSNAVIEDLFKRLPGITVWGDGVVTVNGRTVNKILVDGKEFFGGNINMALQNIPKQAVDKIQVYQRATDPSQPVQDSTTDINIKLKKGWKTGKFGKISAGAGSDERYEADLMLSAYTSKSQLAVVGATNNINKNAGSLNELLENGSYKSFSGLGSYKPDFRQRGIRKSLSGGLIFRQDFLEGGNDYNNQNTLGGSSKIDQGTTTNLGSTLQTTLLTEGQSQTVHSNNSSVNTQTGMDGSAYYNLGTDKRVLRANATAGYTTGQGSSSNTSSTFNAKNEVLSNNNNSNINTNNHRNLGLDLTFGNQTYGRYEPNAGPKYQLDYELKNNSSNSIADRITDFNSLIDPERNQYFNRRYNNQTASTSQSLEFELTRLERWLLSKHLQQLLQLNIRLNNDATLNNRSNNASVFDFDTTGKSYQSNADLSNRSNGLEFKEKPGIEISRTFSKNFINRYSRYFSFTMTADQEIFFMKNNSEKAFQNLSRNYSNFLPGARIGYNKYVHNRSATNASLIYQQRMTYPGIDQLAPLVDSSQVMNLTTGNLQLQSAKTHSLQLSYNFNTQSAVNPFSYGINSNYSRTANPVTDSTIYDVDGKTRRYFINGGGQTQFTSNLYVRKGFKMKQHTLNLEPSLYYNSNKNASYVNGASSDFTSVSKGFRININYEVLDRFRLKFGEDFSKSTSDQSYRSTRTDATNNTLKFAGSVQLIKGLRLQSSLERTTSISTGIPGNRFTIWSADVTYRFLKGKNAEVRLAAFDILHQNQGLQNYTGGNIIVRSQNNVMQQFFLCTFAYYPRFFTQRSPKK
ncbi:outer membrane beta-barrel protein [Chitinophaga sp. sic0106]|uniref:outer membrane beta-barrel protein n=1 Tax=Chitinophaga sp. sic0106 TaxID=2854785 RepID=UPI001C455772|nr:outer membrane beta-barrel protein [Chitinophaga sp. sic0106]MBV7529823.1 outer membrane beta-barrel protein [Chitinophaga sp. sic0106]